MNVYIHEPNPACHHRDPRTQQYHPYWQFRSAYRRPLAAHSPDVTNQKVISMKMMALHIRVCNMNRLYLERDAFMSVFAR